MMDEWQRRMREEKERERLKQKESAEMLQGYRGSDISEEDKKLKAMKEEERKKQQETAKILQGYRSSGLSEEDRKLKAIKEEERKKQQEAELLLHNFKKTEEPGAKARPQRREDHSYPEPVNKSPSQQNDIMYISPGSVAEKKKSFSSQYQPTEPNLPASSTGNNLQNIPFMEVADDGETQANSNDCNETTQAEVKIDAIEPEAVVETEDQPAVKVEEGETKHGIVKGTIEYGDGTEENKQKDEDNQEETAVHAAVVEHVETRFDVCFSFGIVTDKDSPSLVTYMNAVNDIMEENIPKTDPSLKLRYDPKFQPYVIDEKLDKSYRDPRNPDNIRRLIITAAVPLILSNEASKENAQQVATSLLADAIRSQTFLKLLSKD